MEKNLFNEMGGLEAEDFVSLGGVVARPVASISAAEIDDFRHQLAAMFSPSSFVSP
jgi:hypothetical protein